MSPMSSTQSRPSMSPHVRTPATLVPLVVATVVLVLIAPAGGCSCGGYCIAERELEMHCGYLCR
jgi:hypothetical protein